MSTFTCVQCHGTFEAAWSDDERDAEAAANGFDVEVGDNVIVCDPCYEAIMAFNGHPVTDVTDYPPDLIAFIDAKIEAAFAGAAIP